MSAPIRVGSRQSIAITPFYSRECTDTDVRDSEHPLCCARKSFEDIVSTTEYMR